MGGKHTSLAAVVEMMDSIPCAPFVLPKLQKSLSGEYVSTQKLQSIIELDPGLATTVLRMANSAYFMGEQKCDSITEAILRLGTVALSRLAATSQAGKWLNQPVQGYGWEAGDLCRHSLCVAVSAEVLSRECGTAAPDIAYTAGLIHDVGKQALAYANGALLGEILDLVPGRYETWEKAEKAVLGYSSCDVSKRMLEKWGFSKSLVAVGASYPHPSEAGEEDRALVATIHAAKSMTTSLGYGVGADGFYFEVDEVALEKAGFYEEKLQGCVPSIVERMDAMLTPDGEVKAFD